MITRSISNCISNGRIKGRKRIFPAEIAAYRDYSESHGIRLNYVSENRDVGAGAYGHYNQSFYFNMIFQEKVGFDLLKDREEVYQILNSLSFT